MAPAALSKPALFERLAAGHAAGITVVTPNRRLAQVLKAEFDVFQVGNGKTVWEDADILPLASFAERRYEHRVKGAAYAAEALGGAGIRARRAAADGVPDRRYLAARGVILELASADLVRVLSPTAIPE